MKKNTEISERIVQVIETLGLNPNAFAKGLGYTRSQTIYDIIKGKSKPSFEFLERYHDSEYSVHFDVGWLITGKKKTEYPASLQWLELEDEESTDAVRLRDLLRRFVLDTEAQISALKEELSHLRKTNENLTSRIEAIKKLCNPDEYSFP